MTNTVWNFAKRFFRSAERIAVTADQEPIAQEKMAYPRALNGRALVVDSLDSLGLAGGAEFEPRETALTKALVADGERCLDVGANVGYFTVLLAMLAGPRGKVAAIEPDPENFAILCRNCQPEADSGVVKLIQAALGKSRCTAKLYQSVGNKGMHRLYRSVCCSEAWHEVPVLVGDDLALEPLDFVKIDIEGYEPAALEGLDRTLSASPGVRIMSEFSPLSLIEAGFSPTAFVSRMSSLGLGLWVSEAEGWQPLEIDSLLAALGKVESLDISQLTASLAGKHEAAILEAAVAALVDAGYERPVLETFLWVAESAEERTRQQLRAAGLMHVDVR